MASAAVATGRRPRGSQVLAAQVTDLEAEQDMLRQEIATANAQVLQLQKQSTGSSVALEELNRQLDVARLQTGLTADGRPADGGARLVADLGVGKCDSIKDDPQ